MSKELNAYFSVGARSYVRIHGTEYSMACAFGCGASDAFKLWPDENHIEGVGTLGGYCCLGTKQGRHGCGRGGDGIDLLMKVQSMTFREACEALDIDADALIAYRNANKSGGYVEQKRAPRRTREKPHADISEQWQQCGAALVRDANTRLRAGGEALDYLLGRGLTQEDIDAAQLGYYPSYKWVKASLWGFQDVPRLMIPRGIVIPWHDEQGHVICIRFRRLPGDESQEARDCYGYDEKTGKIRRYKVLLGSSTEHFYRDRVFLAVPDVVMLESELDAIIMRRSVASRVAVIATGSTSWGYSDENVRLLASCGQVLLCFDNDTNGAGDRASQRWLEQLANMRRWKPLWSDANEMHSDGLDLLEWVSIGLEEEIAIDASFVACRLCPREVEHYTEDGVPLCAKHYEESCKQEPTTQEQFMHVAEGLFESWPGGVKILPAYPNGFTIDDRVREIIAEREKREASQRERYASVRTRKVVLAG